MLYIYGFTKVSVCSILDIYKMIMNIYKIRWINLEELENILRENNGLILVEIDSTTF